MKKIISNFENILHINGEDKIKAELKKLINYYSDKINIDNCMTRYGIDMNDAIKLSFIRKKMREATETLNNSDDRQERKTLWKQIKNLRKEKKYLISKNKKNADKSLRKQSSGYPTYVLKLIRDLNYSPEDACRQNDMNISMKKIRYKYNGNRKEYLKDREYIELFNKKNELIKKYK